MTHVDSQTISDYATHGAVVIRNALSADEISLLTRGIEANLAAPGPLAAVASRADDPGRFLSTVQIGITLVGILAGAFSGATLGARLTTVLVDSGMSLRFAEPLAYGGVVALITYLSLIVGELVPKQIALRNAEAVAATVAPGMAILVSVLGLNMLGDGLRDVLDPRMAVTTR